MDRTLILLMIPLVVLDLGLRAAAVVSWSRTPKPRGPRWVWLCVILFVGLFGAGAWFLMGREEEA